MGNLTNLHISQSYQSLIHLATDNTASANFIELEDGLGNGLGVSVNTLGEISASGNIYAPNLSGSILNTSSLVTTSSFNAYTQSNNQRVSSLESNSASVNTSITNINSATASLFTSASLSLYTASFNTGTRNLTFTKGDTSTFSVNIPDVSGSTGNFATTGSNVFIGNQTISGSLFVSGSQVLTGTLSASALRVENNTHLDGQLRVTNDAQFDAHIIIQGADPHLKLRDTSGGGFSSGYDVRVNTGSFEIHDDTHNRNVLSDVFNSASAQHTTSLTSEIIVISGSTSVTLIGNVSASIISASTINGLGNPLSFSTSVDSRLDSLESVSGSFTTTASFNSYTSSNDQKVNSLISATGSYATTGSNTFTGEQIISSSLIVTDIIKGTGSITLQPDINDARVVGIYNTSATDTHITASGGNLFLGNDETYVLVTTYANQKLVTLRGEQGITASGSLDISGSLTSSLQQGYVWVGDASGKTVTVSTSSFGGGSTIDTGSLVTTASFNSYTQSNDDKVNQLINATASYAISSSVAAVDEAQQLQINSLINATSSYVTSAITASSLITASFDNGTRNLTFTKGDTTTFAVNIPDVSGSTINTASFATTGSNKFTGIQTLEDTSQNILALVSTSGSLMLVAEGFNSSSAHITASSNANTNLIFKNNNNSGDTVLAGSSNIISNFPAPTAGFKRYFTTGNVALSNGSLQISASMAFPVTSSGNYYANVNTTVRGPVSSSTWFISNNDLLGTVNFGSSAANNAEKAISGVTFVQNFQNGTFNFIANKNTLNTGTTIRQSSLGGTITFNAASSSLLFENNLVNGGLTLTNSSLNTTTVPLYNQAQIVGGAFIGNSNAINISGSTNGIIAGDYNKQIISSNILGIANTFSLERNVETVSTGLIGTTMIGAGLIVTGSNEYTYNVGDLGKCGGLFVGRFNSVEGNLAGSGETVFAVGTGTGTAARRTGFSIDSGSNATISGSLAISGTFNADLQQGYVWVGNGNNRLTTVATSSFGGGGAAFPYSGDAQISGSLGITGSVNGFVNSISVASSTASINFNDGNMFLLTLPSASTHINPTNIKAGQTINIQITQPTPGTGSVTFPSNVKFAGGNDYQVTATGSAIDLLTFISLDGTNVLATSIKNFI